jgi:hypothetical protein
MTMTPVRTWLWIDELADETGIPLSTLRHWRQVRQGGPPSFTIGRRVAYDRDEVARWVARERALSSIDSGPSPRGIKAGA